MLTRDYILKTLKEIQPIIVQKYHVTVKGLFGSYARQDQKDNISDIDILIDYGVDADILDIGGANYFLEKYFNNKVDTVPEKDIRPELRQSILSEVIRI
jgi:predicted nucleotidyltransferase